MLLLAGAGPAWAADGTPATAVDADTATAPPASASASNGTDPTASCDPLTRFKPRNFDRSLKIDNRFVPLVPGTQFTLQGRSNMGSGMQPHTVILTVTDLVKKINGVWTRILWDRDLADDQLAEAELAFHAQDERGNVWNLGEYPEEFEDGVFVGAPSTWIAGVADAQAGVIVPGRPRAGTPPFLQGRSPDIDFVDYGQVFTTNQDNVCAAGTCYDDVLVVNEFNPLEPEGGIQRKFYAPGVGNVKISAVDDPQAETLFLTGAVRLGKKERREANRAALKLEERAYQISEVYQQTAAARLCQ